MTELYAHQREGVAFLVKRSGAMLCDEQGTGKTRQALTAARQLYVDSKIDRVLVLAPAAVRYVWQEEAKKLDEKEEIFCGVHYDPVSQAFIGSAKRFGLLPVILISYALLPQKRHVEALSKWCFSGKTLLIGDESSFLKSRTAKQTKGAAKIAAVCKYRWLLTGTPIANSPLDLYGQSLVMSNSNGPLKGFANFYHFRSRYAITQPQRFGGKTFQLVTGYQNLDELTKKFAPYVLRREKKDCLDLPGKSYTVREVQLDDATWRVYQELRREALLALPEEDVRPEPNAAVRLLRLCQLTSGHVGGVRLGSTAELNLEEINSEQFSRDVSDEKLAWLCDALLDSELASEQAVVVWARWRRERERLQQMLAGKIDVYGVFGGQQEKNRSFNVQSFQTSDKRRVLVGQVHAGGYGITLHAANTAVYISNSFSYIDRVQSSDRIHRIGQNKACLYIDILACGPRGQRTCDHFILETLNAKKSLAEVTCAAWRKVLED